MHDMTPPARMLRRYSFAMALIVSGCSSGPLTRPKDEPGLAKVVTPRDLVLVDDFVRPWGLRARRLDNVGLVVGLAGTGSDPKPGRHRDMLLNEMRVRRVRNSESIMASPNTSLVLVRGLVPPGAAKGDRFDLEIEVDRSSETTDLQGGWLMEARLLEILNVGNSVRQGHTLALGHGHVLIDALLESGGDKASLTKGKILGGGIVTQARELGLLLRDEHTSAQTSKRVGDAVNRRFWVDLNGSKSGVAIPRDDRFIRLLVHPRYHDNVIRYIRVVQHIQVAENEDPVAWLESLRARLNRSASAAVAALELEALGTEALTVLEEALASTDLEVRFHAAEALAYMNQKSAANVLGDVARHEPAFRWRAFTAMAAMDQTATHEVLISLLDEKSAETRYGAFRALRKCLPNDPVLGGELLGDCFWLHRVSSTASPLVHVAREERPEIVLFGPDLQLRGPCLLFAGSRIVVRAESADQVLVRKLSGADDDETIHTSGSLAEWIRAIVELGGTYPDVVQALRQARQDGVLPARLAFSAIPKLGRTYRRDEVPEPSAAEEDLPMIPVTDL